MPDNLDRCPRNRLRDLVPQGFDYLTFNGYINKDLLFDSAVLFPPLDTIPSDPDPPAEEVPATINWPLWAVVGFFVVGGILFFMLRNKSPKTR